MTARDGLPQWEKTTGRGRWTDSEVRGLGTHKPWKSEARFRLMGDLALCSCERKGKTVDKRDKSDKGPGTCQRMEGMDREASVASGPRRRDACTLGCVAAAGTEPPILGGGTTWLSGYQSSQWRPGKERVQA